MSGRNEVDAEMASDYLSVRDELRAEAKPKPNEYEDDRPRWKR